MDFIELRVLLKTYFDSLYMSQWGIPTRLLLILKGYFDGLYAPKGAPIITDTNNGKQYKVISTDGVIGLEEV